MPSRLAAIEAPALAASSLPARGAQAARILRIARSHLGARFRMGSEGLRCFDYSGLAFHVYKDIWGVRGNIHDMGIYVGPNIAISALANPCGVSRCRIDGINQRVIACGIGAWSLAIAYLHVQITQSGSRAVPEGPDIMAVQHRK